MSSGILVLGISFSQASLCGASYLKSLVDSYDLRSSKRAGSIRALARDAACSCFIEEHSAEASGGEQPHHFGSTGHDGVQR
jgi:hypothetical protein